jgi:ABC-type dipeptide/oligopeptide/nickel transport system permease component
MRAGVIRFIARRFAAALVQTLGVTVAVFFMMRWLPSDPAAQLVGANSSEQAMAQARATLGLDQPAMVQLADFLGILHGPTGPGLLQGSLGKSWFTNNPITEELLRFLPVTLELITYSLIVAFLIAIPVGMVSALRPGGIVDRISFMWSLFAGSQPEFWWGLMFTFVFFFALQQAGLPHAPPPLGRLNPMLVEPARITGFLVVDAALHGDFAVMRDAAAHLMLPVLTLVFVVSGPIVKMVRQTMGRVLSSDYLLYARLAGLKRWQVALYALRAGMGPSLTLIGFIYGFLIGGAVPVEMIFSLNGLGEYSVRAVLQLDFPAIQGAVLVISLVSLVVYLVIDCLHAVIDPRITL